MKNWIQHQGDAPGPNLSLGTFRKNIINSLDFTGFNQFWVVRSNIQLHKSGEQWEGSRSGLKQLCSLRQFIPISLKTIKPQLETLYTKLDQLKYTLCHIKHRHQGLNFPSKAVNWKRSVASKLVDNCLKLYSGHAEFDVIVLLWKPCVSVWTLAESILL